ncbi:hypothetical protein [Chondromyces crocatus]|uniref:Uncharacterized protein n=1 Tax=Chondromyces crocatus TaxID=52 RepID=A0A0K1E9H8_CHOCO|nr:hypothetical protein [Chondromyces crocatus]AKT37536.1 uncharacterized protein CMC5_016770 [Chondromyces crocatus]
MLKISAEQLDLLSVEEEEGYRARLVAFLGKEFPRATRALGAPEVVSLVARQVARARHHGLTSERQLAQFAVLALMFGEGFEERFAWAEAALSRDETRTPAERLEDLTHVAERQLRDATHRD